MPPADKVDLKQMTEQLPDLLNKIEKAMQKNATAEEQAAAFGLGCSLLTGFVNYLDQPDSPLSVLEKETSGFTVGVPKDAFKKFLKQETDLLKGIKVRSKHVDRAIEILADAEKDGGLENLRINAKALIDALTQVRDILCVIEVENRKGHKISLELAEVGYDMVLTVGAVAGDMLVIPFAFGAGNPGGVLLGIVSIGVSLKALWKFIAKGKELYQRDRGANTRADIKPKTPPPRVKKK
jgi:hypothetical protein